MTYHPQHTGRRHTAVAATAIVLVVLAVLYVWSIRRRPDDLVRSPAPAAVGNTLKGAAATPPTR